MTARLFKRGCKVTVYNTQPVGFVASNPQFFQLLPNAVEITDLRIQFKIEKSLDSTPNAATITITNAADRTRALFQTKPLIVRLDAGLDGDLRHVFTGDVRYAPSEQKPPDWETIVQLGDGDRAYRYARANVSYKAGTSVVTALKAAAAAMGLQLNPDIAASADLQQQFATGRSLHGPARDELTKLLAPFGYSWSFQDGKLQILKDQNATPATALAINSDNGMRGSPIYGTPDKNGTPPTLNVKMELYPAVTPGCQIYVTSKTINGIFRVSKLTHTGDTHGDPWTTEVEALPVSGASLA